jgi:formylglycine-generating enzyme required for sulfatase activity
MVSDFRLDIYEVTVGRFRDFVNAGAGTQQNPPPVGAGARTLGGIADQGGWDASWNGSLMADTAALVAAVNCNIKQSWTDQPGANESMPMNCITWFEAFAFCVWDGGFLSTEVEWNYAAAGGSEQRAYPWSQPPGELTLDCSHANFSVLGTPCVGGPQFGAMNRVGSESPRGDGKWGQADLSGNVWEWTLDWAGLYSNPCVDCAFLTAGTDRMIRGGSFVDFSNELRTGARGQVMSPPTNRLIGIFPSVGVRCARSPR